MNKQNKTLAIVIPIYESEFSIITKTSLDSLGKQLSDDSKNKYTIYLIGPNKLSSIINILSDYLYENYELNVKFILFDDFYFDSTASYSKLLKSYDFYKNFENFDYILIYQTDCLMLKDNLNKWINEDYDYIGASILVKTSGWKYTPIVGNGGCSLRKVSWFLDVTNPNGDFLKKYKEELEKQISGRGPEGYDNFEDLYFAELLAYYYGMNKPNYEEALEFAFDMNPDIAFVTKSNPNILPDFLHAYDKNLRWYDKATNIKNNIENYKELFSACEDKHKKLHEYYMKDIDNPSTII